VPHIGRALSINAIAVVQLVQNVVTRCLAVSQREQNLLHFGGSVGTFVGSSSNMFPS
jgi:hypothetical protein